MSTNPTIITAPAGTPFVSVTRDFDATPAQLFRVQTDPELVAQWLGPRDMEITIDEYDVRPGGRYRYIHKGEDGTEYAFRGVFHTVEPDTLVIQTFEWEGAPGQVCLENATYEKTEAGVRLHQHSVFPSVEARDAMVESGMEYGINDAMDRLAELLAADNS
ncbi:SRPBCC family protein [Kribbella catacumbae]|uniref:SRPBCC family protein n=1 Tax=Kribbella catacumbae TaxID=460086 RepID=UPI00036EE0E9|nr:SRPBCC family protein [Kribbella catacumbae]